MCYVTYHDFLHVLNDCLTKWSKSIILSVFFLLIIHSICNESAAYQYVHSCDYNLNASLLTGHLCCMNITEYIPVYKAK